MATNPSIDERWMPEWLECGFADIAHYLAAWARFDQWCQEHRPDSEEETRDQSVHPA